MAWWVVGWALSCAASQVHTTPQPEAVAPSRLAVIVDGVIVDELSEDDVAERGLVAVDLSDEWVPRFLVEDRAVDARGEVPYATTYRTLAAGQAPEDVDGTLRRAGTDRFYELWGIFPTPSLLRARLDEHDRHACHDAVVDADDDVDVRLPDPRVLPLAAESKEATTRRESELLRRRTRRLGGGGHDDDERIHRLVAVQRSIVAVQGHLVCDGFLDEHGVDGVFGEATTRALALFQRREALPVREGLLDEETAARLRLSSRERDWLALLRVVRERVADASGLIEDGSAQGGPALIAGRTIDSALVSSRRGHDTTADGAGDVIGAMADAAVRALGVSDPGRAAAALSMWPRTRVALALPALPAWHHDDMELSVVLEGCDDESRRPMMNIRTIHDGAPLTLARLPTTIGGFQREKRADGSIVIVKKRSPTGTFVWRWLWAQPAWYAPSSSPDDELLIWTPAGPVVNEEAIGPGYRSAYGLMMLPHERVSTPTTGSAVLSETGIRTHGTGNIRSIVRGGASHGCHRLLPVHAGRLASFLLVHRRTRRDGPIRDVWEQPLRAGSHRLVARRSLRGVRYELDPPVPVEVQGGCRIDDNVER